LPCPFCGKYPTKTTQPDHVHIECTNTNGCLCPQVDIPMDENGKYDPSIWNQRARRQYKKDNKKTGHGYEQLELTLKRTV